LQHIANLLKATKSKSCRQSESLVHPLTFQASMFASILACSLLLSGLLVSASSNWIGLYQSAHYSGLVQSLRDVKSQVCYNLLCDGVDNAVSSATWLGWAGTTSNDGLPLIAFFMDKDCKGASKSYKASGETYPSDFSTDGMDNKVTSLIVFSRNVVDVDKTITFCQGSAELAAIDVSVTVANVTAQEKL
jgi:hypothetical protein